MRYNKRLRRVLIFASRILTWLNDRICAYLYPDDMEITFVGSEKP